MAIQKRPAHMLNPGDRVMHEREVRSVLKVANQVTIEAANQQAYTVPRDQEIAVVVGDSVAPIADAGGARTVRPGQTAQITAQGLEPGDRVWWSQLSGPAINLGDTSAATVSIPTAANTPVGTKVVLRLKVENELGSRTVTVPVEVVAA